MGCDIHLVVEKKLEGNWIGIWTNETGLRMPIEGMEVNREGKTDPIGNKYWHAHRQRNYNFFALLAGVRGEGPEPKGLPEDVSDLARILVGEDGSDGHSQSYDSLKDFHEKWVASMSSPENFVASKIRDEPDDSFEHMHPLRWTDDENDIDNYRVIYWFDN